MDAINPILQIKDLRVAFRSGKDRIHAVNGVSLAVAPGKTLGIAGESGCGKSVTAHSILKLLPGNSIFSGGEITYTTRQGEELELTRMKPDGLPMRQIRGREIGMVFQDPMASLNPVYSIGSQLAEKLMANERVTRKAALARCAQLLEGLGLSGAARRMQGYPHEFSGGMKQRVMIAMAMITRPQLLIADEPTTALDVTIQAQILELMAEMQRQNGTAIILITHNMGILTRMADDIAVMYMGRVVESGPRDAIFRTPRHPYTRALLQCVPTVGTKGAPLRTIPGATPDPRRLPPGCAFAPRCDCRMERCAAAVPASYGCGAGQRAACFLYEGGAGA